MTAAWTGRSWAQCSGHLMESLVFSKLCCKGSHDRGSLGPGWPGVGPPPTNSKTKRQRSEVLVGLLRTTIKRKPQGQRYQCMQGHSKIRTAQAQSLVCYVTSRGPWIGGRARAAKSFWRLCAGVPETRTVNTLGFLLHPRTRHLAISCEVLRGLAAEAEDTIQVCKPKFDLTIFQRILADLYEVWSRQGCPTSLGAGCLRLCSWSVPHLRTAAGARQSSRRCSRGSASCRWTSTSWHRVRKGKQFSRMLP